MFALSFGMKGGMKPGKEHAIQGNRGTIVPSITFDNASEAIEFYVNVLGAKERYRLDYEGRIMHAELLIGNSVIMLNDTMPGMNMKSAVSFGGSPISFYIYTDDVDKMIENALAYNNKLKGQNKVTLLWPVTNQFYGDRTGTIQDPFNIVWTFAKHVEDVSNDEIKKRLNEDINMHKQQEQKGAKKTKNDEDIPNEEKIKHMEDDYKNNRRQYGGDYEKKDDEYYSKKYAKYKNKYRQLKNFANTF